MSPKGRAGRPVTNAEQARIEARRHQVATMLLEGRTYREIGEASGVAASTIAEDVKHVREEWKARNAEEFSDLVAFECAKCAEIERVHLPRALAGSASSAHVVLAAMRRRARMLGLDRPEQVQVTVPAVEESPRPLTELFGIEGSDERALARVVCAQLGRGNGDGS